MCLDSILVQCIWDMKCCGGVLSGHWQLGNKMRRRVGHRWLLHVTAINHHKPMESKPPDWRFAYVFTLSEQLNNCLRDKVDHHPSSSESQGHILKTTNNWSEVQAPQHRSCPSHFWLPWHGLPNSKSMISCTSWAEQVFKHVQTHAKNRYIYIYSIHIIYIQKYRYRYRYR